ncbi:hypothetical protein [Amycolatopsis sp. cmx-4-61]|uniref:hypothetical protein n=1 Tax=Amycolatopsis sp. cmx-4-61 TaxID=2790937 RepID=UPI00397AE5DB
MTEPSAPDFLLELAGRARVPGEITAAGSQARFGAPGEADPARGQLWRAAWDDTSLLVLLLEVGNSEVSVVPLTIDPSAEDERSFVLAPDASSLGVAATAWIGLRGTLPTRVLDAIVDQLAFDVVAALDRAETGPGERGPLIRRGEPVGSEFDAAVEVRAEVADDLEFLRSAPALPVRKDGQRTRPLAEMLKGRVDLPALKTALRPFGLTQADVMGILRGTRPVTIEQVPVIAETTGLPAEVVSEAVQPLPPDLAAEAERPRYRQAWRELAEQDSVDETMARLNGAYGAFALAARQTGAGSPRWAERLDQYILGRRAGRA